MASDRLTIKAGSTEPIIIKVGATGLSNLDELSAATFYATDTSDNSAHVTAGTMTVESSSDLQLAFDPVAQDVDGNNAFAAKGEWRCYVKMVMSDSDITFHPDEGYLYLTAQEL